MNQRVLVDRAGASGIGREIVRAFVVNGVTVFVCDIDGKSLDNLAREIPGLTTTVCEANMASGSTRSCPARSRAFGYNECSRARNTGAASRSKR